MVKNDFATIVKNDVRVATSHVLCTHGDQAYTLATVSFNAVTDIYIAVVLCYVLLRYRRSVSLQ